jgi:basic amino acid/polyamine antiporter, APA family
MRNWNVRKVISSPELLPEEHRLARTLSWPHLVALGVGAIVGVGILVLIGSGAARAGPAEILSFAIAGLICAAAALAYAELATMYPAAGSAYTYSYVVFGEAIAWFIGWSLILEYSLVVSTVAVGWSQYANDFLTHHHLGLPAALTHGPTVALSWNPFHVAVSDFGINVPAIFIIGVVAGLLIYGTRESANLNAVLVVVKVFALLLFIGVAMAVFDPSHFEPFMPNGFNKQWGIGPDGKPLEVGVMAAAAIIFFAFYGFDAIATAAEETKNPDRDLAIGIVGSMLICVVLYMAVAAAAIGAVAYTDFATQPSPLAYILRAIHQPGVADFLSLAAVAAIPTVILAFFYGQSRIFFAMARDGLLPRGLAVVSRRKTPVRITLITVVWVSLFAGLVPLDAIAALANAGTLAAFISVCVAMLVMRRRDPNATRKFTTPLPWLVGLVGVFGCAYLFYSLPRQTQINFVIWNVVGIGIYLLFGARGAERARAGAGA